MLLFFRDGGWGMYPTSLWGFLFVAAGFLYLFRPEKRFVSVVICLGFLTLSAGVLGTTTGLISTCRYVQHVAPADQVRIATLGCAESLNNLSLALILALIAGLPILGGVVRSMRQ